MDNIIFSLYIFFFCITFIFVVKAIILVQSFVSQKALKGIILQPYAGEVLKKNQLLIIALFEMPLILSMIGFGYLYNFISFYSWQHIPFLIFFMGGIGLISFFVNNACGKIGKCFLYAIAHNPLASRTLFNKFIIIISIAQAPLLLFIINLIITIFSFSLFSHNIILFQKALVLSSFLAIMMIIIYIGILKAIEKISVNFFILGFYSSYSINNIFSSFMISIGLLEFPLLIALLITVLTTQSFTILSSLSFFVLPFVLIFFSILSFFVSYTSAKVVSNALKKINSLFVQNKIIEKSLFLTALWTQFFIDARILYMFVIIIIIMIKTL